MDDSKKAVRIRVYHDFYGCETGCCGHTVELTTEDDKEQRLFDFEHPCEEGVKEWAKAFAQKCVRVHFPECYESIDWGTVEIDYEEVREVQDC